MCLVTKLYFLMVSISSMYKLTHTSAILNAWPIMKNYDIWGSHLPTSSKQNAVKYDTTMIVNEPNERSGKVLNFFPVPVEEECVTEDGRRSGVCLNVYDCHRQGGSSKGECALGFGACCVFTVTCDQEIKNNVTYIISPGFPALMQSNVTGCKLKIKMMSPDVSQLRFDFIHFSMGQPNRANGKCDGDAFTLTGGSTSEFKLCGQNHGQHLYYEVLSAKAKDSEQAIDVIMNFSNNTFSTRLWEIKVSQIPFSQRAPAGCLQYFTGTNGIIQTFNFAENGRHLANQEYRICIRQESKMCSIGYEPCNANSFKIGPTSNQTNATTNDAATLMDAMNNMTAVNNASNLNSAINPNDPDQQLSDITDNDNTLTNPIQDNVSPANDTPNDPSADDPNTIEGSGENRDDDFAFMAFFTRRSMRSRESRQLYSTCTDRITMPCIIEDFLAAKQSFVTSCLPVHCGGSLCASNSVPCRVESTVTPFGIGVHFGDGENKGSPEDNLGMCLRYSQMNCI